MHVTVVHRFEDLAGLADDWDRLAGDVPFRTWAWLGPWCRHYALDRRLHVLAVRDDADRLVGIAPWLHMRDAARGRVLRLLGSGDAASDYLSLLVEPAQNGAVVEAVADGLTTAVDGDTHSRWDLLELRDIEAADPTLLDLAEQMRRRGHAVHTRPSVNCWRIELPATWDDYLATLSKSHRKQVRRFQRRMLETGQATLHQATDEATLAQGMEILVDLHQRRRVGLGEAGRFACPRFHAFLHEAAERLLARDQLRLFWVELDGRPAAAEFQIACGQVTYAYQAGVDPELLDLEPGRVITIATIQRAIDEGQRAMDLLRGDEPYKAHWRAEPRPTHHLRIVPPRAAARLRHGLWTAGSNVKQWFRTAPQVPS